MVALSAHGGRSFCWIVAACLLVAVAAPGVPAVPLTLNSSLSVSERYDNNLYLSDTDPVGDLTTTVSPRVDLAVEHLPVSGALSYQATAEWYRQRRTENRLSHQGELQASVDAVRRLVPRLDLQVSGSYTRAGELPGTTLSGLPAQPGGTVLLPRTDTVQWRGAATARYPWTRRLETRLEYAFAGTRYEALDLAALGDLVATTPALTVSTYNSASHDARLALRYRLSPTVTLTVTPSWNLIRIDPVQATTPVATDSTVTNRLMVGAEYSAGETLTVQGQIGAMLIEDDQTRLVVDVSLYRRWARGRFSLTGGQETGVGGGVAGSASILQRLGADLSQSLGARTQTSLALSVTRNVSLADDPSTSTVRVMTYTTSAGVTRELLRWLSGRLTYSYLVQRTDGVDLDGQRHVIMATLTATTPPWRLMH